MYSIRKIEIYEVLVTALRAMDAVYYYFTY
jgi:hypothetical protein